MLIFSWFSEVHADWHNNGNLQDRRNQYVFDYIFYKPAVSLVVTPTPSQMLVKQWYIILQTHYIYVCVYTLKHLAYTSIRKFTTKTKRCLTRPS